MPRIFILAYFHREQKKGRICYKKWSTSWTGKLSPLSPTAIQMVELPLSNVQQQYFPSYSPVHTSGENGQTRTSNMKETIFSATPHLVETRSISDAQRNKKSCHAFRACPRYQKQADHGLTWKFSEFEPDMRTITVGFASDWKKSSQ